MQAVGHLSADFGVLSAHFWDMVALLLHVGPNLFQIAYMLTLDKVVHSPKQQTADFDSLQRL